MGNIINFPTNKRAEEIYNERVQAGEHPVLTYSYYEDVFYAELSRVKRNSRIIIGSFIGVFISLCLFSIIMMTFLGMIVLGVIVIGFILLSEKINLILNDNDFYFPDYESWLYLECANNRADFNSYNYPTASNKKIIN